jgi:hypothetical protein
MAYLYNPSGWTTGYKPTVTDYQNIAADIATRGDNYDFARYGAPNCSFLTLVPGDLPGATYTVTAASWSGGIATLTLSGASNIKVGQRFSLSGVTPTGYNTTDSVATTGTTGTTLNYAVGSNPGAWVSGGTVLVDRLSVPANGTLAVNATGALVQYVTGTGWVVPSGISFPASANVLGTNGSSVPIAATRANVDAIGYAAGGGAANAQTVTLAPAVTALVAGLTVAWLPTAANTTTTPTLAVNGLTAKTIVKVGGNALAASDLTTTAIAVAIYDGTNWELQNPQTVSSGGGPLTWSAITLGSGWAATGSPYYTPACALDSNGGLRLSGSFVASSLSAAQFGTLPGSSFYPAHEMQFGIELFDATTSTIAAINVVISLTGTLSLGAGYTAYVGHNVYLWIDGIVLRTV